MNELQEGLVRGVAAAAGAEPEAQDFLVQLTNDLVSDIEQAKADGHEPLDVVRAIIDEISPSMAHGLAEQLGEKIGCREGCNVCCNMSVSALDVEVDRIVARIVTLPIEQRDEILARVRAGVRAGLHRMGSTERYAQRTPCPLLLDGKCSVYEDRPIACRSWHGFDAERCSSLTEKTPLGILALMGDCGTFAVEMTTPRVMPPTVAMCGDLLALLAERLTPDEAL